jgi:hypothetical protein
VENRSIENDSVEKPYKFNNHIYIEEKPKVVKPRTDLESVASRSMAVQSIDDSVEDLYQAKTKENDFHRCNMDIKNLLQEITDFSNKNQIVSSPLKKYSFHQSPPTSDRDQVYKYEPVKHEFRLSELQQSNNKFSEIEKLKEELD